MTRLIDRGSRPRRVGLLRRRRSHIATRHPAGHEQCRRPTGATDGSLRQFLRTLWREPRGAEWGPRQIGFTIGRW